LQQSTQGTRQAQGPEPRGRSCPSCCRQSAARINVNCWCHCIAYGACQESRCREQIVGQPGGSPRSRTRRDRGRSSSGCCRTFPARTDSITSQGTDMANVPATLVKLAHAPRHSIVAIERSLTLSIFFYYLPSSPSFVLPMCVYLQIGFFFKKRGSFSE
jgi:hypothetical protein